MRQFKLRGGIFFVIFCMLGGVGCGSESMSDCADLFCPEGQVCVDAPGEGAVCVEDPQWVMPSSDNFVVDAI